MTRRKPKQKPKAEIETVSDYIARTPEPTRSRLKQLRTAIRSALPKDAKEVISYRIPAFKTSKILVWYATFSNHGSLFPTGAIIEQFKSELRDFSATKGSIHFPHDQPLPIALIRKIVRARVAQVQD